MGLWIGIVTEYKVLINELIIFLVDIITSEPLGVEGSDTCLYPLRTSTHYSMYNPQIRLLLSQWFRRTYSMGLWYRYALAANAIGWGTVAAEAKSRGTELDRECFSALTPVNDTFVYELDKLDAQVEHQCIPLHLAPLLISSFLCT